jgi:hypothetical protein
MMRLPLLLLCALLALAACKRETREWRTDPAVAAGLDQVKPMSNRINGATPTVLAALSDPYEATPISSVRASDSMPGSIAKAAMPTVAVAAVRP